MNSIIVNPKDEKELAFITELFRKLGVESKVLSEEDIEDISLSVLLRQVDRSELASEEEIRSKLTN